MADEQIQRVIVIPTKSVGISILLTLILGPFGMFYSTIWGGIIMTIISVPLAIATFGLTILITLPICVIWSAIAAYSHNRKLLAGSISVGEDRP